MLFKKVNALKFGKTGELTIDTFFAFQKDLQSSFTRISEDEFETALELLQKFIAIAAIKIDRTL